MRRFLIGLMAILLICSGCSQKEPVQSSATEQTAAPTVQTEPAVGLYDPDHLLEKQTGGALKAYPLESGYDDIAFMGQDILAFSCSDGTTSLLRLEGDTCVVRSSTVLSGEISPRNKNVWAADNLLVYYSQADNCLIILDKQFRETGNVMLPEVPLGTMTVSTDLTTLYYGTEAGIRALEIRSGISRMLRQGSYETLNILQPLMEDTLLMCQVEKAGSSYIEFISTEHGQTVGTDSTMELLSAWQDRWFAMRSDGPVTELLYGEKDAPARSFLPEAEKQLCGALELDGVVAVSEAQQGLTLELYDLFAGTKRSVLNIKNTDGISRILANAEDQSIWLLSFDAKTGTNILCRWDTAATLVKDDTVYTAQRFTAQDPDKEGLTQCQEWADALNAQYGLEIGFAEAPKLPAEYEAVYEYQVSALRDGLAALEKALARFPEGFLEKIRKVSDNKDLHITLVRDVRYSNGAPTEDGQGLQYWVKGNAYIALAADKNTEQNFYHQLCHVMETFVMAKTSAYDTWDTLNPEGFAYDGNYTDYSNRHDSTYLEGENRAFIDAYSMTFAKEDRATVMAYAMMEGNEELFQSEIMQAKLQKLCDGIRRAYKWRKDSREFPWEQYLKESMAYTKK